jgi:hypothetical protein
MSAIPCETPILARLRAAEGTGKTTPKGSSVGKGTIGKYSGKRRGPRTQASRFCGIGSFKGRL